MRCYQLSTALTLSFTLYKIHVKSPLFGPNLPRNVHDVQVSYMQIKSAIESMCFAASLKEFKDMYWSVMLHFLTCNIEVCSVVVYVVEM